MNKKSFMTNFGMGNSFLPSNVIYDNSFYLKWKKNAPSESMNAPFLYEKFEIITEGCPMAHLQFLSSKEYN